MLRNYELYDMWMPADCYMCCAESDAEHFLSSLYGPITLVEEVVGTPTAFLAGGFQNRPKKPP